MSFKDALQQKDFVVTAELPLTADSSDQTIMKDANRLREYVDGFLIKDNPCGQAHIAPSAAANILLRNGLSPILQLNCRTRNRIALLGELLGARAVGVDSLMLVRGTLVPAEYKPRPVAVMDVSCRELIGIAKQINEDEKLGSMRTFLIGTSATVHDPNPDWRASELRAKADAGASLIITQLCLNTDLLRRYLASLIEQQLIRELSVIVSVAIIVSESIADWIRNNRRDSIFPDDFRIDPTSASGSERAAIRSCASIVREIATIPGVSGVNFVSAGSIELIPEVIERSGINKQ